jgi:hypothetical protein
MKPLTRIQALSILPAVIDNEASDEEKRAFFEYIKEHPDIATEYENAKKIKFIFSVRCPKKQAPDHLKHKIFKQVQELDYHSDIQSEKEQNPDVIHNEPEKQAHSNVSLQTYAGLSIRYLSAAAVVLFISLLILQVLDRTSPTHPPAVEFIVENMSARHFLATGGAIIDPHFATESTTEAEQYLFDHYGLELTVPQITGARFAGIVIADFIDNFETPMFEYIQPDLDEIIYVFVFDVDSVKKHKNLKRYEKAVESCVRTQDFYVVEIGDHHVVSWLWNNVWYTAISNHNGYDLASLIVELNTSPE